MPATPTVLRRQQVLVLPVEQRQVTALEAYLLLVLFLATRLQPATNILTPVTPAALQRHQLHNRIVDQQQVTAPAAYLLLVLDALARYAAVVFVKNTPTLLTSTVLRRQQVLDLNMGQQLQME